MKKSSLILAASLCAGLLPLSALASSDDSPIQLDAFVISTPVSTPSCDASITVNGAVNSHSQGSPASCSTYRGPSSTISVDDLKSGPISIQLHNADSHTVKSYDDTIPASAYSHLIPQLTKYQHKSITFNYPYKGGTVTCNAAGETSAVFKTKYHEQVEICFAGYNS